jgi:hypothetical protein
LKVRLPIFGGRITCELPSFLNPVERLKGSLDLYVNIPDIIIVDRL